MMVTMVTLVQPVAESPGHNLLLSSNSTEHSGNLKPLPNTTFNIDFYSNAAVDASGNGEGAQFFGTTSVNTNINGDATINVTFPTGLPSGRVITATATDPNGNTSEFSAADASTATGSVQFSLASIHVLEDIGVDCDSSTHGRQLRCFEC